ncbi:S41 family peptidase [Chondrinema litorale]|uniref:S41 family peptidase n=1 Tax=Chondrinema litorale TaxID=2994555 RepID=UPI002543ED54|nr:S41 family peptidase [Chondrinema litorale]UZR93730.1 S41 family peptidase [Chondrinema litorale]
MEKPSIGKIIYLLAICSFAIILFSKVFIKNDVDIEEKISKSEKEEVIVKLASYLQDFYVFPEKGKQMSDLINSNLIKGKYSEVNSYDSLAELLTVELRGVVNDKHLRIRANAEQSLSFTSLSNVALGEDYGITDAKILNNNIGYLAFDKFPKLSNSSELAVAEAMETLKDAKCIIIDLRNNGGGDPAMVQLYCSYFFDENPVHLNSLYLRPEQITREFYTLKEIRGKRMPDKPLYLLTSDYTFSGAEEFCYNLKHLKRAKIIGEVTGGGAHPVNAYTLNESLIAIIPVGRAINPITKTNWERVGVKPDSLCDSEKALDVAIQLASRN